MRKKSLILLSFVAIVVVTGSLFLFDNKSAAGEYVGTPPPLTEYNAANEFSLTQGGTTGVWGYGHSVSGVDDTFVPATQGAAIFTCGYAFANWTDPAVEANTPALGHNPGSSFFCSSGYGVWTPDTLIMHPGYHFAASRRAVLRWTAPSAGTFLVNGSFLRHSQTATTDVRILKNVSTTLFSGNVNGGSYDQPFSFTVTVAAADTLDFSVGSGGDGYYGDQTLLALTIGQPVTACQTAPGDLRVSVPAENSPSDVRSGNTNATLVGDAAYTNTGKVGRAFTFDGAGDYVRIEDNAAQKPADQLTLEGWFKLNATGGIIQLAGKPLRNSFVNSYGLYTENGLLSGIVGNTAQYTRVKSNFNPQIGVWHHLAFTYEFAAGVSTLKLYANGIEVTSAVDGTLNLPLFYDANPYPFLIGADFENDGLAFPLNGQADEVSLYSRALTQAELFDLTKHGSFGKCPPASCSQTPADLISWYQGESNALDSKSDNHGTNSGVTYTAGQVGQGFFFDNNLDAIATNTDFNQPYSQLSVESWVYPTAHGQGDTGVSQFGRNVVSNSEGDGFALAVHNGFLQVDYRLSTIPGSSPINALTSQLSLNQWSHIAMTYNGAVIKGYVNGVEVISQNATGTIRNVANANSCLMIGNNPTAACAVHNQGFSWRGGIDEPAIYSRGLTQTEIQSIVNAGQSGKCKPSPLDPPANQIAWLTGDGDGRDFAGLDNNGTLSGTTFGIGKVGQAFQFDGVDDHISFASPPTTATDNWTMEAWINPANLSQQSMVMSNGFDDGGSGNGYTFGIGNGCTSPGSCGPGNRLQGLLSGIAFLDGGFTFPSANQWYHVVMLRESGTIKFYVNGVQTPSTSTAAPTVPTQFRIGSQTGIRFFNGLIDEASIYGRGLSASEVAAIYNAGVAGKLKSVATPVNLSGPGAISSGSRNAKSQIGTPGSLAPTVVQLTDATVTFAQVTTAGTTSQNGLDLGMLPRLPANLTATGLNYDISTTAVFTTAVLCFNLPSISVESSFNNLRIFHLESSVWQDRTEPSSVVFATRTICTTPRTSFSPFVIAESLAPSASSVSVSGRVTSASGNGINGAILTLSDSNGVTRSVRTSGFGYYRFDDVQAGENYVISVASKRFIFAAPTRIVFAADDVSDADFVSNE